MIEKVRVLRTLKAGNNIWGKGEVVGPPVPDDLLSEISKGFVEVVRVTSEVKTPDNPTTTTSKSVSSIDIVQEPQPSKSEGSKVRRVRRVSR